MRRPYTEHHSLLSGAAIQMSAEITVGLAVIALLEQIDRQVRRVGPDFLFGRFHKQLLPVQTMTACSFYPFILKNSRQIFKAFSRKSTIIFSVIFFRYIHPRQFFTRNIVKHDSYSLKMPKYC